MESYVELKKVGNLDVFFRNPNYPRQAKTQPEELEIIIQFLTSEEFEDCKESKYKRKLKHPENFEIIDKYQTNNDEYDVDDFERYVCLCSENTCSYLMIVKHIPTKTYIALGSICYLRFNEENETEIYYHCKAKKCNGCKKPLVFKECKFVKNTNKKCDGNCYGCFEKKKEEAKREKDEADRVYLNVEYANKDDAKSMGAWWDVKKRKWYAPNNSSKYTELIKKYK